MVGGDSNNDRTEPAGAWFGGGIGDDPDDICDRLIGDLIEPSALRQVDDALSEDDINHRIELFTEGCACPCDGLFLECGFGPDVIEDHLIKRVDHASDGFRARAGACCDVRIKGAALGEKSMAEPVACERLVVIGMVICKLDICEIADI